MISKKNLFRTFGVLGLAFALLQPAFAVPVDITYIGTWDTTGSGNGGTGPGITAGQRYVIRITYDDNDIISTPTDNVDVLDAFFNPSGNTMRTISLTDAANSLDIFVPMEGLDAGTPFIYTQNETDHFFFGTNTPVPTLNFVDGSDISNAANIIGLEFEGDFVTGAGSNIIELFNTAASGGPINMVSQVLNLGTGIASTDTNGLAVAVDLEVNAGADIVYNATTLTQTTASAITQSNDLGAARGDNEDFIDAAWSQTGAAAGTNLNDITVGIANSGLTNSGDTATWNVVMTEQMTGRNDADSVMVTYMNALPTANATATATAAGTDFALTVDDMDFLVNALIAGFEALTVTALVDGVIDATAFFAALIPGGGMQSNTNAQLEAAFGLGLHDVTFLVTDLAGAMVTTTANFLVEETMAVSEPGSLALMMLGLLALLFARRRPLLAAL